MEGLEIASSTYTYMHAKMNIEKQYSRVYAFLTCDNGHFANQEYVLMLLRKKILQTLFDGVVPLLLGS
jgi:hypothetical protein